MSELISTKLSTRCGVSLNNRLFFSSLSMSSVLVTMIVVLALYLSLSTRMFSMDLEDNSHLGVYEIAILSGL